MGSAGLDYIAVVSSYPAPDQKIRTEAFEVSLAILGDGSPCSLLSLDSRRWKLWQRSDWGLKAGSCPLFDH